MFMNDRKKQQEKKRDYHALWLFLCVTLIAMLFTNFYIGLALGSIITALYWSTATEEIREEERQRRLYEQKRNF